MMRAPVLFIPHGGGPLPLLGDAAHKPLSEFLRQIPKKLAGINAILVISAHWEEACPTLMTAEEPGMLYDYYGFPAESYELQYPAKGSPELARQVKLCLGANGIEVETNGERGFDHGVFVPLMLMYPEARLPVLQLSLNSHLDPAFHYGLGEALSTLRDQGVLILGSGLSFHNLRPDPSRVEKASQTFDDWLYDVSTSTRYTPEERRTLLIAWSKAPEARFCHPREEHLLPLHVCAGAAGGAPAKRVFKGDLWRWAISGYLWDE